MSQQQYINPIFLIDSKNNKCADCLIGDSAFISINNGILICAKCAEKHKSLGYQISYLHDIKQDLDSYLYRFVEFGGNTKWLEYLQANEVTETTDFEIKYKCAAVDFYRRNLKAKVLNLGELIKDYANPLLIPENNRRCFEEFETYINTNRLEQLRATMRGGNKVGNWFKAIGNKVVAGATNAGHFIGEKATTAGQFIGEKATVAKNAIVETAGNANNKIKRTFTKEKKEEEKKEEEKKEEEKKEEQK